MKDYSSREIQASRPTVTAEVAVEHCIRALLRDTKHRMADEVVAGLIFEELCGALLLYQDRFEEEVSDES